MEAERGLYVGPVMRVYTLYPQMGNGGAGKRGSRPWCGLRGWVRLWASPPLRVHTKVSVSDIVLATCLGKHTLCGTCRLWNREIAYDILMLKQLLVVSVVL